MKTVLNTAVTVMAMTAALTAHAGKAERDFLEAKVLPAVKAASAQYKKACAGDLKIDVKFDSFSTVDDLRQVVYLAEAITEAAPAYCKDKATQTVMGRMKVLEISKAAEPSFSFSGSKGVATTDVSSYPSWDMMAAAIDR